MLASPVSAIAANAWGARRPFQTAVYHTYGCRKCAHPKEPTGRLDLSERAYLLTVPFWATVKSLSVERPVDAGAAQVRCCHDLALVPSDAHRMGCCNWPTPRALNVRFGSEADILRGLLDVR